MKSESFNSFIEISNTVGASSAFVQGGGGNTSLKLDSEEMYIKASGFALKEMTLEEGFSVVNYQKIQDYLDTPDKDEDVFTKKIKSFKIRTNARPSIETGFHAVLGKCVIHTHSVYSNILSCSVNGKGLAKEFFPSSLWVNYASPGSQLTIKVKEALKNHKNLDDDIIVFLQNHGLIVSSNSPEKALKLHSFVNEKIKKELDLPDFVQKKSELNNDFSILEQGVLFPDQVVYTVADKSVLNTEAAIDTLESYRYIVDNLKVLGLTPLFLSSSEAGFIKNMESEKFRLGVLKSVHSSTSS